MPALPPGELKPGAQRWAGDGQRAQLRADRGTRGDGGPQAAPASWATIGSALASKATTGVKPSAAQPATSGSTTSSAVSRPGGSGAAAFDASERAYRVVMVSDAISGAQPHHLEVASRIGVVPLTESAVLSGLAQVRA